MLTASTGMIVVALFNVIPLSKLAVVEDFFLLELMSIYKKKLSIR